jgi:hypothetical protein
MSKCEWERERERERQLGKGELMYVWSNAHVKWGEAK